MKSTISCDWKAHITRLSSFQNTIKRISSEIEKSSDTVWLEVNPVSISSLFIDELSSGIKKNIHSFILKKDVNDDEVLLLDFESMFVDRESLTLKVGKKSSKLLDCFSDYGIDRVKKVWEEGEYSHIGDSITLWPVGRDFPIRLEIEDEKISHISILDINTRKTIKSVKEFQIFNSGGIDIFDSYISRDGFKENLKLPIIASEKKYIGDEIDYSFQLVSLGLRSTQWDYAKIKNRINEGWEIIFIINHNVPNAEEIRKGLPEIKIFEEDLGEGFESEEMKLMVLTDYELWGTVKISKAKHGQYSKLSLDEITPGDFVVHEDHGIALYSGIKEEENGGELKKYIELKYAGKDRLLVPLTQLHKVTKYIGSGSKDPKLTRLSGGEWSRVKRRVTEAVRKIALELLRLYAARDLTKVSPIKLLNGELEQFESDFEFVETEDQVQSIEDVYSDLQKEVPMDRLIVGDVGFGKTEVAMRAAFLSVKNDKQVAVLAPTTILVEQHYQVFKSRMEKYGIKVAALSRFLDRKEVGKVVNDIKNGDVDVIIGTHRLLSKDIEFKNLGLLVLDEEQKFGVSQKEKIKNKKLDVHVLSLSATPIPRTLNMALSGVRDISVITTAPPRRIPIKNFIKKFDWKDATDAIKKEVERGGQVYFVHNRVKTIGFVYEKLRELLPGVRFIIGHGQMSSERLSKTMRDFNEGKYDVLICSTIIENGLDMPNVNTLIVDRAEMFGLSQLYQIRGRVGRGDRQAYAHFYYYGTGGQRVVKEAISEQGRNVVSKSGTGILLEQARQRLQAIESLESLGSGFELSQRDLEIRGSGNFLGKEQHGNVNSIGFSLYCRLLSEMVEKLRKSTDSTVKE